jgi:nucleoside 2-deoxyribosyltransferase
MSAPTSVCVIGQALLDVMQGPTARVRLGGIIHTARALWAIGSPYRLGYFAPEYLDEPIRRYCKDWGGADAVKIGNTTGAPNLIVVPDPKEVGSKGYELIWRLNQKIEQDLDSLKKLLKDPNISDIIIFPDQFDLTEVLTECAKTKARIYIDINFGPKDRSELGALGRKFDTIIISTSAAGFESEYGDSPDQFCKRLFTWGERILLKENRGGSRLFGPRSSNTVLNVSAQVRPIVHSVGVGDCFNAVFVVTRRQFGDQLALNYASCIAAEYATYFEPEEIKEAANAVLAIDPTEMTEISGVQLPWEKRPAINVYIAAPDFTWVDRRPIDEVAEALRYHNFTPRLPVRENGQMKMDDPPPVKSRMAQADRTILDECKLLLAVLLYDDPGTLIEIGLALERGIPVLVYDPYQRASNLMLTELPKVVSPDLDQIIAGVFTYSSRPSNA